MCPLGAVKALRAAALHDALARVLGASDAARFWNRTSEIVEPARTRAAGDCGGSDHQASKRSVIGGGRRPRPCGLRVALASASQGTRA